MSSFWTEERIARAAKIWNDGGSGGDIARELGCSRNAAIGIAFRHPDLFNAKPKRVRQARMPKPVPVRLARVVRARATALKVGAMSVSAIIEADGAWPVETPIRMVVGAKEEFSAAVNFVPPTPITFLEVTDRTCRWPLWPMEDNPGAEGQCCGAPTDEGSSWCVHHRLRARAA